MKKRKNIFKRRINVLATISASFALVAFVFVATFEIFLALYNSVALTLIFVDPIYRNPLIFVAVGIVLAIAWLIVAVKVPPRFYRYGVFTLTLLVLAASGSLLVSLIKFAIVYFQSGGTISFTNINSTMMFVALLLSISFLIIAILFAVLDLLLVFPRGRADKEALIYEQEMAKHQAEATQDLATLKKAQEIEKETEKERIKEENEKNIQIVEESPNVVKTKDQLHPELIINYNIDFDSAPFPHPLTVKEQIEQLRHLQALYQAGLLNQREVEAYKKRIIGRDIKNS
ncbi:MAG TPA: hypothetical protein VJZ05_01630 [Bacilli bacterium]|jgi:hypothetical protein|nr:hypothetical protein [Bacilli bacterium]MDD3389524.1 hypothetical protein [Bacilli bacterium]MDD4344821.1 hypothetical protein [Bacilli bacterium]MDD4520793.1 hypothetical protein [Bacilli bacterium]HKM11043.1 hypothetical protein [Bacilli bacterium]